MNVEVVIDKIAYPVSVRSVNDAGDLSVCFENEWRPSESVKIGQCRVLKNASHADIKVGDEIEALFTNPEGVNGWQKGKVREIKGGFVCVDTTEGPKRSDAVSVEKCRSKPTTYGSINPKNFKTVTEAVPADLDEYFQSDEGVKDLDSKLPETHVEYNSAKKELVFSSFSIKAVKRAEMLIDMYFKDTRTTLSLKHRTSEIQRLMEGTAIQVSANHVEEFTVDDSFMGLVIGKEGSNIREARETPGVVDIEINEDHNPVVIKVYADDEESALAARAVLEFTTGTTMVTRNMVGKVVGKNGHAIQEIVDKSGVMRVQIANGDADDSDLDPVPFIFTGLRDSVEDAIFLLEYNVKHFQEVQDLRDDVDEMHRKLNYHRSSPPLNGSSADYRSGSRGGPRGRGNFRGGRGGRGNSFRRGGGFSNNQENGRQNDNSENSRGRRGRGGFGRGRSLNENGHS